MATLQATKILLTESRTRFNPFLRQALSRRKRAKFRPTCPRMSMRNGRHVGKNVKAIAQLKSARLPKPAFVGLLSGLRHYIAGLQRPAERTVWSDYAQTASYGPDDEIAKRTFVGRMVGNVKPAMLFDLGCNTGYYSEVALAAGARYVVGFDFDQASLDLAYARFSLVRAPFLPLWMDAANPSPAQGWAQIERQGFGHRAHADALIALAFVHHLAIARNVPLAYVVDWLVGLAPVGIIEFPQKADPMVQQLLARRDDIFLDYSEDSFIAAVHHKCRVIDTCRLENGRLLVWYERHTGPLAQS